MRYTVQSSKYVLKNFFYVFPFAAIPALLFCLSTDKEAIDFLLTSFFTGKISDWEFSIVFKSVSALSFSTWQSIVFGLIGIMATVVCVSLMMALMEKHMRIGKRTFNGIFSKLNDNFVSTSGYTVLLLLIYELFTLIVSALLFLLSRIPVAWLAYTCVVGAYLIMIFAFLYGVGIIYLWLPCMQLTGFRPIEALNYSNQLTSSVKWRILFGQLFCLISSEIIISVCAIFMPTGIWFVVVTTLAYAFLIMVYCVRMQITYFDLDQIERMDKKKYY